VMSMVLSAERRITGAGSRRRRPIPRAPRRPREARSSLGSVTVAVDPSGATAARSAATAGGASAAGDAFRRDLAGLFGAADSARTDAEALRGRGAVEALAPTSSSCAASGDALFVRRRDLDRAGFSTASSAASAFTALARDADRREEASATDGSSGDSAVSVPSIGPASAGDSSSSSEAAVTGFARRLPRPPRRRRRRGAPMDPSDVVISSVPVAPSTGPDPSDVGSTADPAAGALAAVSFSAPPASAPVASDGARSSTRSEPVLGVRARLPLRRLRRLLGGPDEPGPSVPSGSGSPAPGAVTFWVTTSVRSVNASSFLILPRWTGCAPEEHEGMNRGTIGEAN
jgi:hypothetical protein